MTTSEHGGDIAEIAALAASICAAVKKPALFTDPTGTIEDSALRIAELSGDMMTRTVRSCVSSVALSQHIREALKRARREAPKRNQAEVAADVGVTSRTLGSWERGQRSPTWRQLDAWADAVGFDASQWTR